VPETFKHFLVFFDVKRVVYPLIGTRRGLERWSEGFMNSDRFTRSRRTWMGVVQVSGTTTVAIETVGVSEDSSV
jgi:hypothetical protein